MKKTIYSVLMVLMCMPALPFQAAADDYPRGDNDHDTRVTVADVSTLIDYLLNGIWDNSLETDANTFTVNGVTFNMVTVEGGTFMMGAMAGDSDASNDEKPAHSVTLTTFRIAETEVTQALWLAVMGTNPSPYTDNLNCPVENVSWIDAHTFIAKLNQLTGKNFRLPTEAEWEYAARGGKNSHGYLYSGSNDIGTVAWYSSNSGNKTHAVATKLPNELGIYDMTGNVWEICQDRYASDYYSNSPWFNPTGPSTGNNISDRGGSWYNNAGKCRVTYRDHASFTGSSHAGLRLAM